MAGEVQTLDETIVARATPPGEGAIAIVRLSGRGARQICDGLIGGGRTFASHVLTRADLLTGDGALIDGAMVVQMHAPRSYTGEDVVELHLHGGRVVVATVLERCLELGARTAAPGEFTLRAFLNGRIDLAQAEAVGDLISAADVSLARAAAIALGGGLSLEICNILNDLESVLVEWRASMDFPEHDSGSGYSEAHFERIERAILQLYEIIEKSRIDLARERRVVLCGAPNVGKSTLLNALAGSERVLVHREPGTTRDVVEVSMARGGRRWSLLDTAGIRDGAGDVETRGIELALDWIQRCETAIWVVDPQAPAWPPVHRIPREVLLIGGKADLATPELRRVVDGEASRRGTRIVLWVSGETGEGIEALHRMAAGESDDSVDEPVITRERQLEAARRAHDALLRLGEARASGLLLDVLCMELERATHALGELLGRNVDLDVLDGIFSRFCIGK